MKLNIEESLKTLRRLERFGFKKDNIDFEWPTKADVEADAFRKNKPIKLSGFVFKAVDTNQGRSISALQLLFSNGLRSPLFLTKGETKDDLTQVNLDVSAPIASIKSDNAENVIR